LPKRGRNQMGYRDHFRPVIAGVFALFSASATVLGGTLLTSERVASDLIHPLFVTHVAGDFDRLFIVEQPGRIRVLDISVYPPVLEASSFLDIADLVHSTQREQGLLGLAFHPNYLSNGFFYVNYTSEPDGDTVVSRFQVVGDPTTSNAADKTSETQLLTYRQPDINHNGGWLGFGPNDGFLYISSGDGGGRCDDQGENAQDTNQLLGKLLRIRDDGTIPDSNPFVGQAGRDEIWAYGLRNPWRCAFDNLTGDLFITDVGQFRWEEIDWQPAASTGGENYGWLCLEANHCAIDCGFNPECDCPGLPPIYEYGHNVGCSITGGEVYRGCAIPNLGGTYFFADFCTDTIWSFRWNGTEITEFQDRTDELATPDHEIGNISSFGLGPFGEIYICDWVDGEVFKILPDTEPQADCNRSGTEDSCDILAGLSLDENDNEIPDECESSVPATSDWGVAALILMVMTGGTLVLAPRRQIIKT